MRPGGAASSTNRTERRGSGREHFPSPTTPLPTLRPIALIGTWRCFGAPGPVHGIIAAGKQLADGDRLMRVRVVGSGEELDYRLSDILDDPAEH
jgi:hypothetical protein